MVDFVFAFAFDFEVVFAKGQETKANGSCFAKMLITNY